MEITAASDRKGSQTHRSSLTRTPASRCPIGETWIGRQGKNQRRRSKGEKKATPRPPFVHASRRPCDSVQAKRNASARQRSPRGAVSDSSAAVIAAKAIECVKPR